MSQFHKDYEELGHIFIFRNLFHVFITIFQSVEIYVKVLNTLS